MQPSDLGPVTKRQVLLAYPNHDILDDRQLYSTLRKHYLALSRLEMKRGEIQCIVIRYADPNARYMEDPRP